MGILTNREIATLFWLLVGALTFRSIAKPLAGLVFACVTKPFAARTIAYMAAFSAACVWVLHEIGVWELDNLKTTILWFIGVSIPWAVDFDRLWRDPNQVARKALVEAAGIATTIAFVTNSFTFPLWAELLMVPLAAVLAFLSSGKPNPEARTIDRVARGLLISLGWCLLGWAFYSLIRNPKAFFTWENAREFLVPLLLSVFFTAFMYVLNVRIAYKLAFAVMGHNLGERSQLRRYAKWLAIRTFGLDIAMLRRWKGHLLRSEVKSRRDLLQTVATVKSARARERNPPGVAAEDGWSPFVAMGFLRGVGLRAENYGLAYLGEWRASAPYKWLGEYMAGNHLEYDVRGTEAVATKLELTLDVRDANNLDVLQASRDAFASASSLLLFEVFGEYAPQVIERLQSNRRPSAKLGLFTVTLTTNEWGAASYELILAITHRQYVDPLQGPRSIRTRDRRGAVEAAL